MKKIVIGILVLLAEVVFAQEYEIISLGTFGGATSAAYSLNDNGYVVGEVEYEHSSESPFPKNAFLWNSSQTILLGQPGVYQTSAYSINNSGQIVGRTKATTDSSTTAFYWDSQNGIQQFNASDNASFSVSYGINNVGQMAVYARQSDENYSLKHVSYSGNLSVGFTELNSPTPLGGIALNIGNAGQIVGTACPSLNELTNSRAFILEEGQISILDTLGGNYDRALSVNSSGLAVGSSKLSSLPAPQINPIHAAMWMDDDIYDLGTLGGLFSEARSINEHGLVVGYAELLDGTEHACLWQDMQIIDLNTFLPENSGWDYLKGAYDINIHGQIVGVGLIEGQEQAFLMNPVPEPTTLILFIAGSLILNKRSTR